MEVMVLENKADKKRRGIVCADRRRNWRRVNHRAEPVGEYDDAYIPIGVRRQSKDEVHADRGLSEDIKSDATSNGRRRACEDVDGLTRWQTLHE
ncbi:unnamed protein product [Phytophthora fragariaefolia]|uniref:Unnamed protein product n=1 Tax=Phytophthora fragariaefolia TaxID=1490495 RepID=A0A9W6TZF0_9STRA|nr:unnamed protein product [Phytophthora fragariaefolia]